MIGLIAAIVSEPEVMWESLDSNGCESHNAHTACSCLYIVFVGWPNTMHASTGYLYPVSPLHPAPARKLA